MPVTYRQVEPDVIEMLDAVMREHHGDLAEEGVTVSLLFAHAAVSQDGEIQGPALKLRGWPALAVVGVVSYKDRVEGRSDARILLDGDRWPDLSDRQRRALLDHELEHLTLVRREDGKVRYDAAGRPRLKMRPHDYELGGFWAVVDRHGKDALESLAYRHVHAGFSQRTFPWG